MKATFATITSAILLTASLLLPDLSFASEPRPVIAILGDSYSTFEGHVTPAENLVWYPAGGHDHTDVDSVQYTWWRLLTDAPDSPGSLGVNNSYSGATICYTGYRGEDYSDRAFVTRMDSLGDPDIILVFGATNDSWAGAPIGEYKYEDITPDDLRSFRPAMARMLAGLGELYPDAQVWFILNTELKPEINESVETVCARYGVPVIKLEDIDKDWGHPTRKGMRAIALQVKEAMARRR